MTMNFFVHVRIIFKYFRFFLKDHWTKIDENQDHFTPLFWGGYDGYPRDFSGNVVGGILFNSSIKHTYALI